MDETGATIKIADSKRQLNYPLHFHMEATQKPKSFAEIIAQEKPVLVDFYTDWCGPCKMIKPILEELKSKMGDRLTILKVDVDKNASVAAHYKIQSVPTLVLFKNNEIKWRQSGVVPVHYLEQIIRQHT